MGVVDGFIKNVDEIVAAVTSKAQAATVASDQAQRAKEEAKNAHESGADYLKTKEEFEKVSQHKEAAEAAFNEVVDKITEGTDVLHQAIAAGIGAAEGKVGNFRSRIEGAAAEASGDLNRVNVIISKVTRLREEYKESSAIAIVAEAEGARYNATTAVSELNMAKSVFEETAAALEQLDRQAYSSVSEGKEKFENARNGVEIVLRARDRVLEAEQKAASSLKDLEEAAVAHAIQRATAAVQEAEGELKKEVEGSSKFWNTVLPDRLKNLTEELKTVTETKWS